jgi:thiol-disulfide isomerase/thioredoxin
MSWIMILFLVAVGFLVLMPMLTMIAARRMVGTPVEEDGRSGSGDRMIYFYSPSCGPCRSMTPIVERLAQESDRVVKVDIQRDPETARAFHIRATPTTILVKQQRVLDVALGAKTEKQLQALLKQVA